jgi:TolA-binding protein
MDINWRHDLDAALGDAGAQHKPVILVLDADGTERHRVEGFIPTDELIAHLALGRARVAFEQSDWAEAERRFRTVAERHPNSEAAPEAVYWAGVARHKDTKDGGALTETARAIAERYPASVWAKKSSVWARSA